MIIAVVPINDPVVAKSRLAGVLDDDARAKLARAMYQHVLRVLCASPEIDGVLVLTPSVEVARVARARGAEVTMDPPGPPGTRAPLGPLVDAALAQLDARGIDAALVVMSDLPRLAPADVSALVHGLTVADVVVAPDRHRLGTNALGVRLAGRAPTCFGHVDSFARHVAAAGARRLELCPSPSLALDVDLPEDLALVRPRPARPGSQPEPEPEPLDDESESPLRA